MSRTQYGCTKTQLFHTQHQRKINNVTATTRRKKNYSRTTIKLLRMRKPASVYIYALVFCEHHCEHVYIRTNRKWNRIDWRSEPVAATGHLHFRMILALSSFLLPTADPMHSWHVQDFLVEYDTRNLSCSNIYTIHIYSPVKLLDIFQFIEMERLNFSNCTWSSFGVISLGTP